MKLYCIVCYQVYTYGVGMVILVVPVCNDALSLFLVYRAREKRFITHLPFLSITSQIFTEFPTPIE
jgi:hypothetical protein